MANREAVLSKPVACQSKHQIPMPPNRSNKIRLQCSEHCCNGHKNRLKDLVGLALAGYSITSIQGSEAQAADRGSSGCATLFEPFEPVTSEASSTA